MLEEKQLNGQASLDVNITNNDTNNYDGTNTVGQSVDINYSVASKDMDSPVYSSVEAPIETLDIIGHDYVSETPVVSNEQPIINGQNNVSVAPVILNEQPTMENKNNVVDVPVVSNEQPNIENQNNVSEVHETMDSDLKSNLIFMVIITIIILAVIFALPYIS